MGNNKLIVALKGLVESFLPDNNSHTNRFEIHSESSDRVYIVAQAKSSGEWQCSCPGWILKRAGKERSCKHLKQLLPLLNQIQAPAEVKRIKNG